MLYDMADPRSANFGKHMSGKEVHDMFAPAEDSVESVREWLRSSLGSSHAVRIAPNKQWLSFDATIGQLEELLQTKYHEYGRAGAADEDAAVGVGCDEYRVPGHVHEHIDFVTPGVKTLDYKRNAKRDMPMQPSGTSPYKNKPIVTPVQQPQFQQATENICGFAITPDCIRAMYNVNDTLASNDKTSLGIYETGLEYPNQTDLNYYFVEFSPNIPNNTFPTFAPIDGAPPLGNVTYPGTEADLDFEASYPFVYPDEIKFFSVNDYNYEGVHPVHGLFNTFLDALDASYCTYSAYNETGDDPTIDGVYPDTAPGGYDQPEQCGAYTPTDVISISYSIDEDTLPMNYQLRQCNEWMKLGLQGVSVIVSSGDQGVMPRSGECAMNNTLFAVQSPINCPYITSVGGTTLPPGSVAGKDPETATTSFGSSGGFSNVFPRPAYQDDVIESYFQHSPPPYPYYNITYNATHTGGIYNRGGRGIPDVAATGQNFAGYVDGQSSLIAGTSVSTPVFAGLITRIVSARKSAGKGALGFLNPTLYQNIDAFNDITKGNNPGCGTPGFSAVEGWDPVTGLGTPNYGVLKEILMGLQ